MYLLDTHVLLWLASDQEELSDKAKDAIKSNPSGLFISSISAFEIALKARKNLIILPIQTDLWIKRAIKQHKITEIPVDSQIAIQAVHLPRVHNDPCDRIILATAVLHKLIVLSKDATLSKYAGVECVW